MHVDRFEVYRVHPEPAKGREMNEFCPCVVGSSNEFKDLATVVIAPLTSRGFELPSRAPYPFEVEQGLVLLDRLRAVDKLRLGTFGFIDTDSRQERFAL